MIKIKLKQNQKAQTEILGLVVIVLMIMIILLIASYVFTRDTTTPKQIYLTKQLAQNYVNTMIDSDSGCSNYRFSELIEDCASNDPQYQEQCFSLVQSNTILRSCDYLNESVASSLKKTFGEWGYVYSFSIVDSAKNSKVSISTGRTLNKQQGIYFSNDYSVYFDVYS